MNTKVLIASAVAGSLMFAAPAFAFAHEGVQGDAGLNLGLHLGQLLKADVKAEAHAKGDRDGDADDKDAHVISGTVTAKSGTTLTLSAKNGTTYTVDAAKAGVKGETLADVVVGDQIMVVGDVNGSAIVASSIVDETSLRSHITGGVVTSVSGGIFTIDPFGADSTTTVTTNSSTVFKGKHATSSADLKVGSRVLIFGTSTASTTAGTSFTASIVKILGNGFGHLKAFFGLGIR